MEIPDLFTLTAFSLLTLVFFIVITGRYLLVAGIFYFVFYKWFPQKWKERKINQRSYPHGQFRMEIKWSLISSFIFAVTGSITVLCWQKGFTKIYIEVSAADIWYMPLSLAMYMLLQETYYYWIHRWMHRPRIFKLVHKVHHDSRIASPFTAFSFHPLEAILQAIFIPALLCIIPIHLYVIVVLLVIMSISSVINHLDIEIYPTQKAKLFTRWVIGASHHAQHHKQYKYNYGLYFTFWDRWKNTESPFSAIFGKKPPPDESRTLKVK